MAYDKQKIYKKALAKAKEPEVFFIEDVVALVPCSRSTFYEMFPGGSDELDTIKEHLEENKVNKKVEIRQLLAKGKGMELVALYKLLATDEERKKLSMSFVDVTTKGQKVTPPPIDYSKLSDEALEEIANATTKPDDDGEE